MNNNISSNHRNFDLEAALEIHKLQKASHLLSLNPPLEERLSNLNTLENLLLENKQEIAIALNKDYGNRSIHETLLAEVFTAVDGIRYAKKNLRKWTKPQKRSHSIWFLGVKNTLIAQPKGVVGVISPWNYPLFLFVSPVTSAFAAGNRCMVKMAKESSNLSKLLKNLVDHYFDTATLAIIPDISGSDFTKIPFDHLVFTGSASTARYVMAAASKNLTPITLELGGKSPCIVDSSYDHSIAAKRIMYFKTLNAGQTCVAPDYVFVHEDKLNEFIHQCKKATQDRYSSIEGLDYTSIISEEALNRLQNHIDDAKNKGAKVYNLMRDSKTECIVGKKKLAPHIVIGMSDDSSIMQEEIFGPLLPIKTYKDMSTVSKYINSHANPLGLYVFSHRKSFQNYFLNNTLSGAIAINDCALQVAQHDMPFGGIGESGMGHYHAHEGFKEFSKLKPIFKQAKFSSIELLYPPYGKRFDFILKAMLKLKI
ncbi:aldehyde dehydrogenase family protein [Neptunomonas concharum]|uniref:Aldehyde dehydrogenase n=1 Tax=Neptunomonas concharum TaxID=1031538 RepID=A0A5P1RD92_9GAMM|nr:aldehyde dehydrogenase family protein [Neptunomonas concharum]QEQ97225.1 aldehyde dehydrogenase family protein [Neptunomonas concharum]